MDRLANMHGKKFLRKQRLHFAIENKIATMDRLPKIHSQKIWTRRLDFPFENKIETMDKLAKTHE